jgi:hypothetical protein
MKNTIFYTSKSVPDYWHAFSCCLKAGFSSFFWTNPFAKKLVFYGMILLLGLGFTTNSYGQLVGGAAVKANFGIDADGYANLLQFGDLPGPSGTDDWFNTTYPGPGKGVIKQTDPIPATPNEAFSFRQSITTPTAPFPYPVVGGLLVAPWTGSYLWLDAVYGRDNYVKGGNAEKSYFAGSGDKNSDNPSTWSIGTSGSVPQKDDIIDVYAHIRGEGIRIPDADPRPFTTLWAYAGASLVVTNGNKHIDFEFFRTALETPADLSVPGKTGPDGGRTAWKFNPDGTVMVPGTIIVSVDYTNGGDNPVVRIRVWMDETVFNSYDNSALLRPFTTVPGTFEKGTDSGTFGYGRIDSNAGATNIWGRVNDNDSTLGPPWGTFEGVAPDLVTHYQALQFVEIGINLTAFGLDVRGSQDPCSNLLGSLLVKTRSSGGGPSEGAFGSELKDFAGPYLFGNTGRIPVVSVPDKTACAGAAVDLTFGATTDSGPIKYYTDAGFTNEILTPASYVPGVTHIFARSESLANPGCYGTDEFDVIVNAITPGVIAGSQTLCTPFNPASFTSTTPGSGGGTITYQWQMSTTSAVAGFSNIGGATSATYDAPAVAVVTWFRRTATSTLNSVPCSDNSNVLVVTPNAVAPGAIAGDQTLCTPADPAAFTSTTPGSGDGVITYQWQISTTSCVAGFSNIGGATSATYDAPMVDGATYFRRVTTSTLNGVECSANSNCLTITPEDINPGEISGSQTLCAPFDPVAFTSVIPGSNNGVITYQWQSSTTSAVAGFSNIGGATSETYDAPAVAVVTWFRRTATTTLNTVPCSANSNVLVVTPNAITPGMIAGSQTLCTPFNPEAFTSTTPGSGGGTITYQWQSSTTSAVAGFSNIGGATSETYDAPAVAVVTWFRRTATSTLNSVPCSDNSNVLVVTPNAIVPGVIAGNQTVCVGADPVAFTSTTPGSGGGIITYQWQSNITGCDAAFTNIGGATAATYDAPAVAVTTYYRRVATSTLNDVVCSDNSNCLTVTVEVCGGPLCTYTQGYYGNVGGLSCAPDGSVFTKYTTKELIAKALISYGGTMYVGIKDVRHVSIMNNATDIDALIAVLPGGGGSSALPANPNGGLFSISNLPQTLLKKGNINNTLLAQTIALGLNIGINGALGDFVLQAGKLTTADTEGGCGSDIPKARTCNPDGTVNNEYERYDISADVVNALSTKTIQGLYAMANNALGGAALPAGVTLEEIAEAVDNINNAFDECRIFIGYDVPLLVCPVLTLVSSETTTELAGFTASPVPFEDQLTIKYDFDYQSDVTIEVFNAQGILILSKNDTNSYLNKEITLDLNVNRGQEQVFIVKLTTDRGSSTKKIMSSQ